MKEESFMEKCFVCFCCGEEHGLETPSEYKDKRKTKENLPRMCKHN
jgi:hypothetical protein